MAIFNKTRDLIGSNGEKEGVVGVNAKGEEVVLLNPNGKAAKYADELKRDCRYTNKGEYKADADGVVHPLTKQQRAYRSGYLAARKDAAKAYKAKHR